MVVCRFRDFFHSFSVTAGGNVLGVRPSSGAAMLERERAPMNSDASEHPVLAAPEPGALRRSDFPPLLTDDCKKWKITVATGICSAILERPFSRVARGLAVLPDRGLNGLKSFSCAGWRRRPQQQSN